MIHTMQAPVQRFAPVRIQEEATQLQQTDNILATGSNVVYIPSFTEYLALDFIARAFTRHEQVYCGQISGNPLRYAATWAAKEAVYRALKKLDKDIKLCWHDVEIQRTSFLGKPVVRVKKLAMPLQFDLTISNDGDYVCAVVVCINDNRILPPVLQ